MSKEKAELIERLNALQQRISELGLGCSQKLLDMKEQIEKQLDLLSKKENDGGDN